MTPNLFNLDIPGLRSGYYADQYFENITRMLSQLAKEGYRYHGDQHMLSNGAAQGIDTGNLEVEMQWFTRRPGQTIVVGVEQAVQMLLHASGFWQTDQFISTVDQLEIEALQDGSAVHYDGDPTHVMPVLKVRGRYRDFAALETATLGVLTRSSRLATNVYDILKAAKGKSVLFFPARFDLPETQAADGYAYYQAVQLFNERHGASVPPFISTHAQGAWWGGRGSGTIAHAAIATFIGDLPELMINFARTLPVEVPRIALVDFKNDSVGDSLAVCEAMFREHQSLIDNGQMNSSAKFKLEGVRLDTSGSVRDVSVSPSENPDEDRGVNARLVWAVREALDSGWQHWAIPDAWRESAQRYCLDVRIVVSGGFGLEKIRRFEADGVPADVYAVGSSFLSNDRTTRSDYTADVVRIKLNGKWVDVAKAGRKASANPALRKVMTAA